LSKLNGRQACGAGDVPASGVDFVDFHWIAMSMDAPPGRGCAAESSPGSPQQLCCAQHPASAHGRSEPEMQAHRGTPGLAGRYRHPLAPPVRDIEHH
jgi:hypothetical protein